MPIALGYIYGVVPVSLCRSGGCATVTNIRNGKGVNLDFDEDGDPGPAGVTGTFGTSQSSSRSSMRDKGSTTGVVTVVATVNNRGAGNVHSVCMCALKPCFLSMKLLLLLYLLDNRRAAIGQYYLARRILQ